MGKGIYNPQSREQRRVTNNPPQHMAGCQVTYTRSLMFKPNLLLKIRYKPGLSDSPTDISHANGTPMLATVVLAYPASFTFLCVLSYPPV